MGCWMLKLCYAVSKMHEKLQSIELTVKQKLELTEKFENGDL
jgi:hypothetical protein